MQQRRHPVQQGFTLLELLVVLVVMAIGTGLVSARLFPDDQRLLDQEAERLAQILTIAQEQSDVRAQNLRLQIRPDGFYFTPADAALNAPPLRDDLLGARRWQHGEVMVRIETDGIAQTGLVFTPEQGIERTLVELQRNQARCLIVRRSSGRFQVVRRT
jgi:general secretion pathway protein H